MTTRIEKLAAYLEAERRDAQDTIDRLETELYATNDFADEEEADAIRKMIEAEILAFEAIGESLCHLDEAAEELECS